MFDDLYSQDVEALIYADLMYLTRFGGCSRELTMQNPKLIFPMFCIRSFTRNLRP
jgi:hypothetical protein